MAIIHVTTDGDVVILGNFGRLMNDPRHVDAARDVRQLLEDGRRGFVLDLKNLREIGDAGLGLLTTITRLIRQYDGEAVLANVHKETERFLDEMRMDAYWEIFERDRDAVNYFKNLDPNARTDPPGRP